MEHRCRPLSATLDLSVAAGKRAGVTRVSDVTAFGVPGIPVFQATRPCSKSLTVSQGKGLTPAAAIVGALLETTELWLAERLEFTGLALPLSAQSPDVAAIWSADEDELQIALSPDLARGWVGGTDLGSGRACPMPWDLLSLNFTRNTLEYCANSNGLASGNSRAEALLSGIAELLEHLFVSLFHRMSPRQRLACQVNLHSISDPVVQRLISIVSRAGFEIRAWSLAQEQGLAVFEVTLLEPGARLEDICPAGGNGCHPDAAIAFARALLEAVQSRAALVAGARDDLGPDAYRSLPERLMGILLGTFAIGDGPLDWNRIPSIRLPSTEQCLDFLLKKVSELTPFPVLAFDHEQPAPGLHVTHVLCPGLLDDDRGPRRQAARPARSHEQVRHTAQPSARKVLFGGPSIAGLKIPSGIEVLPPAKCGDLAALLADPPAAVGLVDGVFRVAPTVWHREIESLIALGVQVMGAASLGALRAAELDLHGMEGVGTIYEAYRSGAIVRDDAVMLVHAPAELGYAALSVAQVDAEHILQALDIPPTTRRMMQRIVRTTAFEDRTWDHCLKIYRERTGQAFPVSLVELEAAPSLKRADAALLIEALHQCGPSRNAPAASPPMTSHYRAMLARSAPAFAATLP